MKISFHLPSILYVVYLLILTHVHCDDDDEAINNTISRKDRYARQVNLPVTHCLTFDANNVFHWNGHGTKLYTHRCAENCLNIQSDQLVYGTEEYSEDSPICLAALHAGIINPAQPSTYDVWYREGERKSAFYGSLGSRVLSETQELKHHFKKSYVFLGEKAVPEGYNKETWLSDVYLIHNSANGHVQRRYKFWITCLSDGQMNLQNSVFYDWKFKSIAPKGQNKNRTAYYQNSAPHQERIWSCLGSSPLSDVTAVVSVPTDDDLTNSTIMATLYSKATIRLSKADEDADFDILHRSIQNLKFSEINLQSDKKTWIKNGINRYDANFYEFGNLKTWPNTYFQLIVKECGPHKYGKNCNQRCRNCLNRGVCHSLTGSCICKPGFSGASCGKGCPLGTFGSRCHLSCTGNVLGWASTSTNCEGLKFCLPKPYGCSCAFGYTGYFCEQAIPLDFPALRNPPTVRIVETGLIKVIISKYRPNHDFGHHYGLEIENYLLQRSWNGVNNWLDTTVTFNANGPFEVIFSSGINSYHMRVIIKLKNENKLGRNEDLRRAREQSKSVYFSFPCLGSPSPFVEDSNVHSLTVSMLLPQPAPTKCDLLRYSSNSEEPEVPKETVQIGSNQQRFLHEVVGLPSGELVELGIRCSNSFGSCDPVNITGVTAPVLKEKISYKNHFLKIKSFYLLKETSTLTVVSRPAYNISLPLWDKHKDDLLHGRKQLFSSNILEDFKKIADKKNFSTNGDYYELNLTSLVEEEEDKLIGLILQYPISGTWKYDVTEFVLKAVADSEGRTAGTLTTNVLVPILVLILVAALIVGILWCYRSRLKGAIENYGASGPDKLPAFLHRTKEGSPAATTASQEGNDTSTIAPPLQKVRGDECMYGNIDDKSRPKYETIRRDNLEVELNRMIKSPVMKEAFNPIPQYMDKTMHYGQDSNNLKKNRYKNNLPYDDTLVYLTPIPGASGSDYINANHVKGFFPDKKWYIASQGPKDTNVSTLGDFWRMIVETKVTVIIMVANFVESGKVKVGTYFDREQVIHIEDFIIEVKTTDVYPAYIKTIIDVKWGNNEVAVQHYQYTVWKDHHAPNETVTLADMLGDVRRTYTQGGCVVHCSAGIGRTGTILLVLLMEEELRRSNQINPLATVQYLRECRGRLVENYMQFDYGLQVFDEWIFGTKGTIDLSDNVKTMGDSEIKGLYKNLSDFIYPHTYHMSSKTKGNSTSNQIPDSQLVYMNVEGASCEESFISACRLQVDDIPNFFIATKYPDSEDTLKFWWMIISKKCYSVFLLNSLDGTEFLPKVDHTIQHGSLVVAGISTMNYGDNIDKIIVEIRVKDKFSALPKQYRASVFLVKEWKVCDKEKPPTDSLLPALTEIILAEAKPDNPVVLACSDGITSCGLVSAFVTIINHLEKYESANVYRNIVKLRRSYPPLIVSQSQFHYLYQVLNTYKQEKEPLYENLIRQQTVDF